MISPIPIPIPTSLVWFLPLKPAQNQVPPAGSPDLASLSLTDAQKGVVDGLKRAGFTIRSAERGKVTEKWAYVTLEVSSPGALGATIDLNEISGEGPHESARCHVYFSTTLPEKEAESKGTALRVKFSNLYTSAANSKKSPGTIEVHFSSNNTVSPVTPLAILAEIAMLRRAAAEFASLKPSPASPSASTDSFDATLKQAGLIYTDPGSLYCFPFNYSGIQRVQTAYVQKRIDSYNSLKFREVYSLFYEAKEAPSADLLQRVFQKRFPLGSLALDAPSAAQTYWRIRFRIDAPEGITPDRLKTYISLAARTADNLEKEFFSEDKLK